MNLVSRYTSTVVFMTSLLLAACSGGSSTEPSTGGNNHAPSAVAGINQTVDELSAVTLDGSASSDPDAGTTLTYSWSQTAGTAVTLSSATVAQPSFDAPDVTAVNTPDTLTFRLTVSDGSLSASDNVDIVVNDIGVGRNSPPTASAGADQTVGELTGVNLDGSASQDPDGDMLSFVWLQMAGPNVTLSDANAEQPSFTAPEVATPTVLTFQLTVDDGADSAMDTVDITVQKALSAVTVAGKLEFEWVNPNNNCRGLDLNNPEPRAMRRVTIQLLDSGNNVLGTTVSGDDGSYSFSNIDANQLVRVRARAELKSSGPAVWDVEVRDNVDVEPPIPPLTQRPLYVIDFAEFNTGVINLPDKNFKASTGWDNNSRSYTGDRQAAPFAILDAVLDAMMMVTDVDPTATFPDLDVYWSVNNKLVSADASDVDRGELTSTFYINSGLYMLGDSATDTEEFDDMVTIHEWGHYFEDNFSRSDSQGGPHSIGEPLDPRLAFGEGFATGLAAIALQKSLYCDTRAPMQSGGFGIDFESFNNGLQGWMNEGSIASLIYDLWDTGVDGTDNNSIGFGPIYETMVGPQANVQAFTSLFTFASGLRPMLPPAQLAFVDSQLNRENVDTPVIIDQWAESQTTVPTNGTYPHGRDIIPYYTELVAGAAGVNLCLNDDYYDLLPDEFPNKFGIFRHFRFTVPASASFTITAAANPIPPATNDPTAAVRDRTDPDFFLHRSGESRHFGQSTSPDDDRETYDTGILGPGTYILRLQDWRFVDDNAASDYPTQTCFDVSMTSP